jgi:hypothetical protein
MEGGRVTVQHNRRASLLLHNIRSEENRKSKEDTNFFNVSSWGVYLWCSDNTDYIKNMTKGDTLGVIQYENVWEYFYSRQWKGGGIDGRVKPRTGSSEWKSWPIARVNDRVALGGEMLVVSCFEGSGPSDNVVHIPVWDVSRSLFPRDGKRDWDVCSWWCQRVFVC